MIGPCRLAQLLLLLPLGLAACAAGGDRGFHPAIDCAGAVIAPDFAARCGPYRPRDPD